MCPRKVFHLSLGLTMVQWSHTFIKINLKNSLKLDLDEQNNRQILMIITKKIFLVMLVIVVMGKIRKFSNINK